MEFLIAIAVVVAAYVAFKVCVRRVTIYEYQRGLKYVRGRFKEVLPAGTHWHLPYFSRIAMVDVRPRFVTVSGQEVLSSDGVTLKVSLAASFRIADPALAVNGVENYVEALYVKLQLALREIVGGATIDDLLEKRPQFSARLMELSKDSAAGLGLELQSVDIRDIMFPGKLKEVFAQVVQARKEGLAALEKARGETAALRNLANAARMVEKSPALLQLRVIQSVEGSRGNTVILSLPSQGNLVPVRLGEMPEQGPDEGALPPSAPGQ
jgi:regulator of protease activity HflC (stomatin/prohibitin superfamily)